MFTTCQFISISFLDSDYNNSVDFRTFQSQKEFFNKYTLFSSQDFDYQRKNQTTLKVGYTLKELNLINYVILTNDDGTRYFYFVMNKDYISEDVTMLYLKMDLIQTYMLRYSFKTCFVEREHIKTTNTDNTFYSQELINFSDEGLETGEYILQHKAEIYDYSKNTGGYVFTSSERLGTSNEPRVNISDDGVNTGGSSYGENYKNGYLDENGLVFLKSKEGFVGSAYQDINGYWTIGYGVTQAFQEQYYNELYPSCSEVDASTVMGKVVYNFSSQVKQNLESIGLGSWLNQNKLNALTSYAYQNGVGGLLSSSIWQAIKEKKTDDEIYRIWYNLGEYSERRQQEAKLFLGEYPTNMKITDHTNGGYVTTNNGHGYIPTEYQ